MLLRNRLEAGRLLATEVQRLPELSQCESLVVLGLPRGGVPVAFPVAQALRAPLDVIIVRKLGVPGHDQLAMGAVGEDDVVVVDDETVARYQVSSSDLARAQAREQATVARQSEQLRPRRRRLPLAGRTVALVDDGIATGSTMIAACTVVRARRASRIVVATPVAPASSLTAVRAEADALVCLHTPHPFMAVGLWYHDFTQVTDDAVLALLDEGD